MQIEDKKNGIKLDSIVCCNCGHAQSNCEKNDNYLITWKSLLTKQDMHACMHCIRLGRIQPTWIQENPPNNLSAGDLVLAKDGEEWFPGTVFKSYFFLQQCDVLWDDQSMAISRKNFNEIKQLMTLNTTGEIIPKVYQYSSLENYLQMHGFDVSLNGIEIKDGLVPQKLLTSLKKNLENLRQTFSAECENKILSLCNPSLFCYVQGASILKNGLKETFDEQTQQKVPNYFGRSSIVSKYQWLPTNFHIGLRNKINIQGYINSLRYRNKQPDLYDNIEQVFSYFVPMIESCLKKLYETQKVDWRSMRNDKIQKIRRNSKLRNQNIQVFVNIYELVLQPGQTYEEEEWHCEGIPQEHIIATAMYYYDISDTMVSEGLQFRRALRDEEEYQFVFEFGDENPPPFQQYCRCVNLGNVQNKKERGVVYPNSFQHKVVKLSNSSSSEIAFQKILQFFIVDPEEKIISTRDVAYQNWHKIKGCVVLEIQKAAKRVLGYCFPQVVAKKIMDNTSYGFTQQQAELYRLELMRERKYYNDCINLELVQKIDFHEH